LFRTIYLILVPGFVPFQIVTRILFATKRSANGAMGRAAAVIANKRVTHQVHDVTKRQSTLLLMDARTRFTEC
jgi:hypothetical protein